MHVTKSWNDFISKYAQTTKDQDNKRITLKIYTEGLKLMDEDNQQLVGEIANYFIPHARTEVVKAIKLENIIRGSAATAITVGRTFREIARQYDLTTFDYPEFLTLTSNALYTAAYAGPQISQIKSKELTCGKKEFYDVMNHYPTLWDLSETYEYLPYFEAVNPLERLNVKTMPSIQKLKAKERTIKLKKYLKCLYRRGVAASSNLFRAIETLETITVHRLDVTDKILRMAIMFNENASHIGFTKAPSNYYHYNP